MLMLMYNGRVDKNDGNKELTMLASCMVLEIFYHFAIEQIDCTFVQILWEQ